MPIILAIESDRRQRDALTAVVRERVGVELILADTTEHALEAIGNRVPDLVLVPALLSPSDDAALAAALRVIAAAAHVRTLTIPVLAAHSASEAKSGLFSRWRRSSPPQSSDGCDPALFAEQIAAYLKESAAERELLAEQEEDDRRRGDAFTSAFESADAPQEPAFAVSEEPPYVQPEMPAAAYSRFDATTLYTQPETAPAYAQAEAPAHAQYDAFSPSAPQAYTRADAEIYTPADAPVPIYTPSYSYNGPQFDSDQPDVRAYAEPEAHADAAAPFYQPPQQAVHAYAEAEAPRVEQHDFTALRNDGVDLVDHDDERAPQSASEIESTLELDPEEDIDLSDQLAELGGDEETGGEELFDGEPIGIYTMPSLTDESEFEFSRLNFGRTRIDSPAKPQGRVEPEIEVQAIAETLPEPAVDPEFFAEPAQDADVEAELEVEAETEVETEIHAAAAFTAETIDDDTIDAGDAAVDADWNPADAEPEPADAEPWVSSSLTARWTWPVLEGLPTDAPVAGFARADSLAAAVDQPAVRNPAPAGPRLVPPPIPSIAVPRATPAKLPTLTVPRLAAAAPAPRPAASGAKSGRTEWSELVASLRKDIERRRTEPPQEKPKPSAAEIVPPEPAPVPVSVSVPVPAPVMRRARRSKPIQDEWGFFDPEQCGFAALLAKLDEITEGAEEPEVRRRR